MAHQLRMGELAPDFVLPEASQVMIKLSDVIKTQNVVIAFYPSDFGMMCAVEIMRLCEIYPELQKMGTEILGISTNSTHTHVGWKIRLDIPFPLLSDFDANVTETYGVLDNEIGYMEGRSKRSIFVIDTKGILRYIWITDNPSIEPDYNELIDVCKDLSAV